MPILRAHGQLGIWDELAFLGITVVFALVMLFSWLRSRSLADEQPEDDQAPPDPGHFELD